MDLALTHLEHTRKGDLLLCDRNYPSFRFISSLYQAQRDFVIRCSASSFRQAREMLKGHEAESQLHNLQPHSSKFHAIKLAGLPTVIPVRFVRVRLNTGKVEVLVTSLLDETQYPTADFKKLYRLRWGIETFFGILKTRLGLENFTDKSAESVYQDFYSSVYLTGLEALLTESVQCFLSRKETRYPQHVNRSVSFNAIKNKALDIPTCTRSHRLVLRRSSSTTSLLLYAKQAKKSCF